MAEIFLARKEGPAGFSKTVVVKRVLPHHLASDDFMKMFLDEARLAAQLEHPNVVHIIDFGQVEGRFYLAMEYLRGVDLSTLLRTRLHAGLGPIPGPLAAAIASQAAAGLHYAHTATTDSGQPLRIVHRDISPSNLFLTIQGVVKVLDFGIAKAEGKLTETKQGLVKGKLLYMSPEQAWGRPLDARSDLWAMGVVLHELISGTRPFFRARDDDPKAANERRVLEAIDREAPPPLEKEPELDQIVRSCLAKRPEDRLSSARDLQHALDHYLERRGAVLPETLAAFLKASIGTDEVNRRSLSASEHAALEVDSGAIIATSEHDPTRPASVAIQPIAPAVAVPPTLQAPVRSRRLLGALFVGLLLSTGALGVIARSRAARPAPQSTTSTSAPIALPARVEAAPVESALESDGGPPIPRADAPSEQTNPRAPAGPRRARARITCAPYGEVLVDGRARGRAAPELELELPLGRHRVTCVHPALGESSATLEVASSGMARVSLQY